MGQGPALYGPALEINHQFSECSQSEHPGQLLWAVTLNLVSSAMGCTEPGILVGNLQAAAANFNIGRMCTKALYRAGGGSSVECS
jgi:hypothetical protein